MTKKFSIVSAAILGALIVLSAKETAAGPIYKLPPIEFNLKSSADYFADLNDSYKLKADTAAAIYDRIVQDPGVKIKSYGLRNSLKTVNINGIAPEQNKATIEGISFNSPQNGEADLNSIDISLFDNARIMQGPQGALEGNNSVGGVLALDVADRQTKNFNSAKISANNWGDYYFSYKHRRNSVFAFSYDGGTNDFAYLDLYGKKQQRKENNYKKINILLKNRNIFFMNGYDYSRDPGPVFSPNTGALQIQNSTFFKSSLGMLIFKFSNFYSRYQNLKFPFGAIDDKHNFSAVSVSANDTADLGVLQIAYGLDDNFSYGKSSKLGTRHKNEFSARQRIALSPWKKNTLDFLLGLSYTDKLRLNYSAQYMVPIKDLFKVRIQYSNGYRLPTFNDLYWPETGFAKGNAELKEERSSGGDVRLYRKNISARAFYYNYENLIKWQPNPIKWMPINIGEAASYGFDFKVKLKIKKLSANAGYSYNQTKDSARGRYIVYIPQEKITSEIRYKERRWFIGVVMNYEGFRFINRANTTWLDGFVLMNLRAGYSLGNAMLLLKADNLTNASYEYVYGYPQPLRTYEAEVRYRF